VELRRRKEDRFPSVPDLVAHLQTVTEREKAEIARELHDELGGLLVAASMDLAWLERQIDISPECQQSADLQRRLGRLKECLAGAVDIKRRIIEELRPTLLDNVGLFAALRWLVSTTAARTGLASVSRFPEVEPHFNPDAAIALFRMAQEGVGIIMESKWVRSITLVLGGSDHRVTLRVSGRGNSHAPEKRPLIESYELAAIRHRMAALAGGVSYSNDPSEVSLCAWLPAGSYVPKE
jgi:signal transduction histidine kinase